MFEGPLFERLWLTGKKKKTNPKIENRKIKKQQISKQLEGTQETKAGFPANFSSPVPERQPKQKLTIKPGVFPVNWAII